MNLLATLSIDQSKRLGDMSWYNTVVPLIAIQLPDKSIGPDMTSGEFLTILLDLPTEVRSQVLQVTVHNQLEADEQVAEIKETSHKGMLIGVTVIFLLVCSLMLMLFIGYTQVEGKTVSKESIDSIMDIIKQVVAMLGTMG